MRREDKKVLKELREELEALRERFEELCDSHQEWMDERSDETDGRWDDTPTGERASEEHYEFEDMRDSLESMVEKIDEMV